MQYRYTSLSDLLGDHELVLRFAYYLGHRISLNVLGQMAWANIDEEFTDKLNSTPGTTYTEPDGALSHTLLMANLNGYLFRLGPVGVSVFGGVDYVMFGNDIDTEVTAPGGTHLGFGLSESMTLGVDAEYTYSKNWQRYRWPMEERGYTMLPSRDGLDLNIDTAQMMNLRTRLFYYLVREDSLDISARFYWHYMAPVGKIETTDPTGTTRSAKPGWVFEALLYMGLDESGFDADDFTGDLLEGGFFFLTGGFRVTSLDVPYDLGRIVGDDSSDNVPGLGWIFEAGWFVPF